MRGNLGAERVRSMTGGRHFLDLDQLAAADARAILSEARARKTRRLEYPRGTEDSDRPLAGRLLALVFESPSTRTRISFDSGMRQLGGQALVLNASEAQWSRGESIADTARALSRYVDAVVLRTDSHDMLCAFADYGSIPVINGMTAQSHPCQVMADVMTFEEHRGSVAGRTFAWIGDGSNVAASWIHAAPIFGFALRVSSPRAFAPDSELIGRGGSGVELVDDPREAVRGADCVVTDTWASIADPPDQAREKKAALEAWRVDAALMKQADRHALFMHCQPAHRGEEVTAEVADGPQSVIFDEAENRLHAQKAILLWCFDLPGKS